MAKLFSLCRKKKSAEVSPLDAQVAAKKDVPPPPDDSDSSAEEEPLADPLPEWVDLFESIRNIDTDDITVISGSGAGGAGNINALKLRDTLRSVINKCDDEEWKKKINGCLSIGVYDPKDGRKAKAKAIKVLESWTPAGMDEEDVGEVDEEEEGDGGETKGDGSANEPAAKWENRRRKSVAVGAPTSVGWQKFHDDESGQAFWFNQVTGESSWVDPNAPKQQQTGESKEFWQKLMQTGVLQKVRCMYVCVCTVCVCTVCAVYCVYCVCCVLLSSFTR